MTIYTTLKQDHALTKAILTKLENNPMDQGLFEEFESTLSLHNEAEERTFYTVLKEKMGHLGPIATISADEHKAVMRLIKLYKKAKTEEEKTMMIKLIKSSLESHIMKEENEIFPIAKDCLTYEEESEILKDFKIECGRS